MTIPTMLPSAWFAPTTPLGDSATNSRFIETVAGSGYRFVPEWLQTTGRRDTDVLDSSVAFSVAVLPIQVVGIGRDQSLFAKMVASALTDGLSGIRGLCVIAQRTVKGHEIARATPQAAGRTIGVSAVVAGEMILSKSDFYLGMELIDESNGRQLAATSLKKNSPCRDTAEELANEVLCQLVPALEAF